MEEHKLQNITAHGVGNLSRKTEYSENFSMEVLDFHINIDQISRNWFKARNGSILSNEDTQQYERIVTLLKDMVKLTEEIKTVFQYSHLNKVEIFEKLRAIVVQNFGIKPEQVTYTANFVDDFGSDSLDILELATALEKVFDIEICDEVPEGFSTIQETIDCILKKKLKKLSS